MNHALPPPEEWASREVSSNHYTDDGEAGRRQKGFRSAEVPKRGTSAKCVDEYMATVQD